MKRFVCWMALAALCLVFSGCRRKLDGPRIWWDDQARERLPGDYQLPENRLKGTERDPEQLDRDFFGL